MKPTMVMTVDMRLRQELRLQPVQILRNELLLLPALDLEARIQEELDENIFLEVEGQQELPALLPEPEVDQKVTPPGGDEDPESSPIDQISDVGELRNLLQYLGSRSSVPSSRGDMPEPFDLEGRVSLPVSWRQDLQSAVRLEKIPDDQKAIAEYIVGCLDDRGYLSESLEDIASQVDADPAEVESALKVVQRVGRAGVGARDLREHLLLLCRDLPEPCQNVELLLTDAYPELLGGKWDRIRRKFGWDNAALNQVLDRLRALLRVSGPGVDAEPVREVTPDARIYKTEDGWKVVLRDERFPRLVLASNAKVLFKKIDQMPDESKKNWVREKMNRAKWLMEALEQRKKTLRRVVEAVVGHQEKWLEQGGDTMVPLRQEDVAGELGLHPATISRTVQGKYVETPHGVIQLKEFFPRGVPTRSGVRRSRNAAKERLQEIVESEPHDKPYSDDELVRRLAEYDIEISRRTVCKYRDELGILPASKRKGLYKVRGWREVPRS